AAARAGGHSTQRGGARGGPPAGPHPAPPGGGPARRGGRIPAAVTADRGYGQPAVERDLRELGVRTVAIPRQAKTSPARKTIEHRRSFHRLVKWRTGCEGRVSYLKPGYGWGPTPPPCQAPAPPPGGH